MGKFGRIWRLRGFERFVKRGFLHLAFHVEVARLCRGFARSLKFKFFDREAKADGFSPSFAPSKLVLVERRLNVKLFFPQLINITIILPWDWRQRSKGLAAKKLMPVSCR